MIETCSMEIGLKGHLDVELFPGELIEIDSPHAVLDARGRLVLKVKVESAEYVEIRVVVGLDDRVELAFLRMRLSLGVGKGPYEEPLLLDDIKHGKLQENTMVS